MAKVIMQPSFGDAAGRANWKRTLDHEVPFSRLPYSAVLSPDDRVRLDALHPSGQARFWGSTAKQDSNFKKIITGDIALFTGLKKVRAVGVVGVVLSNAAFGDQMWAPHPKNGSWCNLYSLQSFEPADIPYEDIWALDGFTSGDNFMGLRPLDPAKSRAVLELLKISTVDREDTDQLARLARRVGDVTAAEQFTTTSTSYRQPGGTTYVYRAESLLITAYRASLPDDQGRTLRVPTGVADFYAEEPGGSVIIEAKSSAQHPFVRQALSQLLDYKRFSPCPVTRLGALFPRRPDQHGIELLHDYGIDCIYLDSNGTFVTLPAPGELPPHSGRASPAPPSTVSNLEA